VIFISPKEEYVMKHNMFVLLSALVLASLALTACGVGRDDEVIVPDLTMAAIVGLAAFGIRALQVKTPIEPLRVAAVQANVPRDEKFNQQFQEKIFQQFTRLTQVALATRPPPQLIIWPESSTPAPALLDAYQAERQPITDQVSHFAFTMAKQVSQQRREISAVMSWSIDFPRRNEVTIRPAASSRRDHESARNCHQLL
jgi:apolipoprotein N-acyltransferase